VAEAFLCDAVRTPIGRYGGALSGVRTDDLAAAPLRALLARHPNVDWGAVDEVFLGCANQAGEDNRNVARMAALLAGLPPEVPGATVNRLCGSGLDALAIAARTIAAGEADLVLAGGVESMSRAPFVLAKAESAFSRAARIEDTTIGWRFVNPLIKARYGIDAMPETAENVAAEHGIARADQDAFALRSQQRALAAQASGRLAQEIVGVAVPQKKGEAVVVDRDEHPRATTLEALAKLRPVFAAKGSVTAGNSSQTSDGAGALIVVSERALKQFNLTPLARFVSFAIKGVPPEIMGIGPKEAIPAALRLAGLKLDDLGWIELNEAFAAQALAVGKDLGLNPDVVNPIGGAIARGHPLGATGAIRSATLIHAMRRKNIKYGMVSMCVGTGMGAAGIFERM
jgi:acetyl-CoA C-acetyltransferase